MDLKQVVLKNTFELGSVRDAAEFLNLCVHSAFPTLSFRGLELIRMLPHERQIEGKSWNHIFSICETEVDGVRLWEVRCARISMGQSNERRVLLDLETLEFVRYH